MLMGWQIRCTEYDPKSIIDNPVFILQDSPQVTILDNHDDSEIKSLFIIDENRKIQITMNSFDISNLRTIRFKDFQYQTETNASLLNLILAAKISNFNTLCFFKSNITYYDCTANDTKSQLLEYRYQGFLLETVFLREAFVGINNSIRIHVSNDPDFIYECKNHVSSSEKF
ncbi:hypothetical protein RF11_10917 [Thelohanellus kitauei]|uniref:Uncharacterized protein n=1 Tax=Thelohanellus kitauei TaxID=669202 RepID=A0A0C2MWI7_THEKT|nr:hypothetical protein RF11_10917 [Thelohanellus kitauei]